MTTQSGRAFNEWLRAQLKAKKMSQRQLALQSGVDHSTISRLIRGDRMPSLGTATKLARGLRELRDDADMPAYLGQVTSTSSNPAARVEYALRADDLLSDAQVRQIMEYYLAVRMRRFGRAYTPPTGETRAGEAPADRAGSRDPQRGSAVSVGAGADRDTKPPATGSGGARLGSQRPISRPVGRTSGRY